MGFTDFIVKISNTKFARKFQYEPYIVKTVEYMNPDNEDLMLVIYKDTDYIQSLSMQYVKRENYYSFEIKEKMNLDKKYDKIVMFFTAYDIDGEQIENLKKHLKNNGKLYSIVYLNSGRFFEWTLRLTDREILKSMKKNDEILLQNGFKLMDKLELPRQYVSISEFKIIGGSNAAKD